MYCQSRQIKKTGKMTHLATKETETKEIFSRNLSCTGSRTKNTGLAVSLDEFKKEAKEYPKFCCKKCLAMIK